MTGGTALGFGDTAPGDQLRAVFVFADLLDKQAANFELATSFIFWVIDSVNNWSFLTYNISIWHRELSRIVPYNTLHELIIRTVN